MDPSNHNRQILVVLLIVGLVSFFSTVAGAGTYSFYPVDDSFIFNANPDTNYDAWNELQIYRYSGGYKRSYLKFDLSSIPETEYVTICSLTLYWNRGDNIVSAVNLHYVSDDSWQETQITWNNRPNQDTYGPLLVSSTVIPNETTEWLFAFPSTEDNDSLSLLLKLVDETYTEPWKYYGFHSREASASLRPRLEVATAVVPLPGTALLLGTGLLGLGLLGRRRGYLREPPDFGDN